MTDVTYRKLLTNCFDKLHEQMSLVRSHVESLQDREALKLLESMETGLLAPMRRMRIRLDIPYSWCEPKDDSQEEEL